MFIYFVSIGTIKVFERHSLPCQVSKFTGDHRKWRMLKKNERFEFLSLVLDKKSSYESVSGQCFEHVPRIFILSRNTNVSEA